MSLGRRTLSLFDATAEDSPLTPAQPRETEWDEDEQEYEDEDEEKETENAEASGASEGYDTDSEDGNSRDDPDWDGEENMNGFALPDPDDIETFGTASLTHRIVSPEWFEATESKDEEGNYLFSR
jgi:hypothetical protein